MTVHWIGKENLERRKAVLACRRLKGRHTYDVLAGFIQKIHREFEIDSKVSMTTTDNGSNFVKAFSAFGGESSQETLMVCSNDRDDDDDDVEVNPLTDILRQDDGNGVAFELPSHNRCAAHNVNLIATADANKALTCATFKKTSRLAFAKAQELWNKQSRSPQAADLIKAELGGLLVIPTQTRWNSVYDAVCRLKTFLEDREKRASLNRACSALGLPAFSNADILFLAEYVRVMKPLCQSLDVLQREEQAYYGVLIPTLTACAKKLHDIEDIGELVVCKPLVAAILDGLKKRFKTCAESMECMLATAFHPHFKLQWIPLLPLLGCNTEGLYNKVRQRMVHAITAMSEAHTLSASDPTSSSDDEFFGGIFSGKSKDTSSDKLLDKYLQWGHEPQSKDLGKAFPSEILKELFIKYNTPIPSSAAVERLFSLGKDVLKPKRSGTSDEHFEMLVFMK